MRNANSTDITNSTKRPVERLAYSIDEASEASTFSRASLYRMIDSGALASRRVGGRRIIPASALRALIEGKAV